MFYFLICSYYISYYGFYAVKDGIINKKENAVHVRKPDWLKVQKQDSKEYIKVKSITKKHKISKVCEEARCPNINEC
ncbi:lipoyl synthase, partial [Francisella tularensis subsp. holarctica]|nr:lipoyl synthase [Francisella tularensis subsp. holarctica]